jgi:hypothetical protein
VIEDALASLEAALARVGAGGRTAERVLTEASDHLREAARENGESAAIRRFGDVDDIARQVAAELATARARRAAFTAFAALALLGAGYALVLGLVGPAGGWQGVTGGRVGFLEPVLAIALVVLPQVAFVAGCLALVGALRLRSRRIVPGAEFRLLQRRVGVALGAGAGTVVALAGFALDSWGELAAWWTWATLAVCALALLPLGLAVLALASASRPMASSGGSADDVFDDLALVFDWTPVRRLGLPLHPWRFALVCAAGVFVVGMAGGWYAESDPASGVVRGAVEAVALLVCFALLGRPLGLRRSLDRV